MAVKNPQFEINIRKNTYANNPGYGKYYPKAVEKQTISLRGLCNHIEKSHYFTLFQFFFVSLQRQFKQI